MQKLVQGVHAFQSQYFSEHQKLFKKLSEGQNPETLFITCSDSRVVPHLITDTQPGDLFLVRNIGNVVPHPSLPGGTAAAVEYAIEVLGVQNVVVCGHTLCGAMRALLDPKSIENLPFVKKWVEARRQQDRPRALRTSRRRRAPWRPSRTSSSDSFVYVPNAALEPIPNGPVCATCQAAASGILRSCRA